MIEIEALEGSAMEIMSAEANDGSEVQENGPETKKMVRIVLADDHPIVRDGLKKLLELEDDFVVVEKEDAKEDKAA